MTWNPFKRDSTARRLKAVQAELTAIRQAKELAAAEAALAEIKRQEVYAVADSSTRARMDLEREKMREEIRLSAGKPQAKRERRPLRVSPDGISFLTSALQSSGRQCSEEIVTRHAEESILEALNGTPFGFDLISEYRNLLQVPTLIRELWPYKPTIIRTLPMLDFARWICRVVYEECLTAKGLVRGKVNYICRGMTAKVIDMEGGKAEDQTAKTAQKIIDKFIDLRSYMALRCERMRRMMIEGEAFLWLTANKDDIPEACYVEPDFIRPSQRESSNQEDPALAGNPRGPDWSFGIRTPHHRYWQPLEFQIVWNDNDEEKVDAADMFHTAVRERSNIKRCLPSMFTMSDDLIRLTLLRAALADASKFRAGVGGVVKYEMAGPQSISDWENTIRRGGFAALQDPHYLRPLDVENATNLIELPPGRDFVQGPGWPDVACLETIYNWHLNAVAQAEQVPAWMVSGATSEASFASSLTSESPSILEFEAESEKQCAVDRKVLRRVLQMEIEANRLDKDFFEKYDIRVEGKSMVARDEKSETESAAAQVKAGFCSVETASTKLGFNYPNERALMDAEKALGIGPAWEQEPGDEEGDTKGGPKTMGGMRQRLEGRRAEEGWDASKHPRGQPENAGEFGPGGGAAVADEPDEDTGDKGSENPNARLPGESRPKLRAKDIAAVQEYIAEDSVFDDINRDLRRGGNPANYPLQEAIEKCGMFESPITARRGLDFEDEDDLEKFVKDLEEAKNSGEPWEELGFMSTSTQGAFPGNVQIEVIVRKGLDASYYGYNTGELLLAAGNKFDVVKVERKGDRVHVRMEQVIDSTRTEEVEKKKPLAASSRWRYVRVRPGVERVVKDNTDE